MTKIIIIYATTDGHTKEICDSLVETTETLNNHVDLVEISDAGRFDLNEYDKVVIGASIRYGKHSPLIYDYIETNHQVLAQKPNAFFSVNVVARKPEKNQPDTNPYLIKFLKQIKWQPNELAVFAGKVDYQKYSFFDRNMIRFIMWMTKGPTAPDTKIDFTNWEQVKAFAKTIHTM